MKTKMRNNYFLSLLFLVSGYTYAMVPNTVVGTIPAGVNPAGIAITPNNQFAYVVNNNSYGIPGGSSVSVLDLMNNTTASVITDPSFNAPYSVTLNPAGTMAYATNSNGTTLTMINALTNTVSGTIGGFSGPSGMVITPAGDRAYVNNYGVGNASGQGTTLSVVDLNTNTIIGSPVTVGLAPAALAISPDGAFVYSANYVDGNPGTGTLSVVETLTNTVVSTIPGFSGPFAMALTPDGSYAYVTNFGSNNFSPFGSTVSVVDLGNNMIVDTINLGIQPSGISITPDGRYAYVTNYNTLYAGPNFTNLTPGQGTVSVIDLATNTVVSPTIPVGDSPANIAISPDGQFAYVSNYTSNTIDVIALQSSQIVDAKGCKFKRKCLKDKDKRTNKLTWRASGSSLPVSYALFRDAQLNDFVATVPAKSGRMKYYDRGLDKQDTYTYYLVATNEAGVDSAPVEIVVERHCKKCK